MRWAIGGQSCTLADKRNKKMGVVEIAPESPLTRSLQPLSQVCVAYDTLTHITRHHNGTKVYIPLSILSLLKSKQEKVTF